MKVKSKILSIFMCLCTALLSGCSQGGGEAPVVTFSSISAEASTDAPVITENNPASTSYDKEEKTTDIFTAPPTEIAETAAETTVEVVATVTETITKTDIPVIAINNETITAYNTAIDDLKTKTAKPYLYNFNTVMSVGIDSEGNVINTEAIYGLTAYVDGRNVNVKAYDHTGKHSVKLSELYNLDKSNGAVIQITVDNNYRTVDTKKFINGLYKITTVFYNGNTVDLYFYVNGNETWLCNMQIISEETAQIYKDRRASLTKLLKNYGVTADNQLRTDNIYYPFYSFDSTWRCDTQLWIDLSDTLVEKNWSDEHKLFTFYEWISENIVYDEYVADVIDYSRARYYNDYSGKQSIYNLKAGTCFDYSHILLIMCRAQGIP
ncbi:MAG: transglutaminase-like domain-containing protein, partial [Ruminiclostridium sp.]|nr:transglutaminase-like domain-containing protein [Ruminiclostridium sp.]